MTQPPSWRSAAISMLVILIVEAFAESLYVSE
jgi:hypothetical protein